MSDFTWDTTAEQVVANVDLTNKRVLITGVSAGLGAETARVLASVGADVIGTARDLAKAERIAGPIHDAASSGGGTFNILELDLADLTSVRRAAQTLLERDLPFDVVVANAGVMAVPFERTVDGLELQFGTNVVGHFVLLDQIKPLLRYGSRVVVLSSAAHRTADIDLDDLNFQTTLYDPWLAYGRSKTGSALLATAFDRRHRGRGVRAFSIHPGMIPTELDRHLGEGGLAAVFEPFNQKLAAAGKGPVQFKTIPQGAATSVWAASLADLEEMGGRYAENCRLSAVYSAGTELGPNDEGVFDYAIDPAHAEAMMQQIERLVARLPSPNSIG